MIPSPKPFGCAATVIARPGIAIAANIWAISVIVIARGDVLIDRSFGDVSAALRAPDIRLGDIRTQLIRKPAPFRHVIEMTDRGVFVYVRRGDFQLSIGSAPSRPIRQGATVGIEDGRRHVWSADPMGKAPSAGEEAELMISSIPRRMGVLQRLQEGIIVVPPDAEPFASSLKLAAELHLLQHLLPDDQRDETVIRRCAEICLIQFVGYSQASLAQKADAPAGLTHDEHLLRAWTAYFADPQRRWTVAALAEAAGLSRTAFAVRFRNVFGAPPLHTLTALRLEQAEAMLRDSDAPLIEIAFIVGYNSEAAFVRAFHRHYGMPPGRFRAEQQGRQVKG